MENDCNVDTKNTLLVTSVAPVPMAAMMGKEWGGMGQNYLRSLLALGFHALFVKLLCKWLCILPIPRKKQAYFQKKTDSGGDPQGGYCSAGYGT